MSDNGCITIGIDPLLRCQCYPDYDPSLSVHYETDFDDPAELTSGNWRLFDGVGNNGFGVRDPNQNEIVANADGCDGSVLRQTAENVVQPDGSTLVHSGGMSLRNVGVPGPTPLSFLYGTVTVRSRQDADSAQVTSGLTLLWPDPNPPSPSWEIDIYETFQPALRATRQPMQTFIHDVTGATVAGGPILAVDGTDWHVYQMSWQPDAIRVRTDCGPWITVTTDPNDIPNVPMTVAIQLDAWAAGVPANQQPNGQPILNGPILHEVDYLRIET